jgi:hypothetical protein
LQAHPRLVEGRGKNRKNAEFGLGGSDFDRG